MPQKKVGSTPAARAASLAFAAAMVGALPAAALANQFADQAAPSAKAVGLTEPRPGLNERAEAAAKLLRSEPPAAVPKGRPPVRQVQWRNG